MFWSAYLSQDIKRSLNAALHDQFSPLLLLYFHMVYNIFLNLQ